MYTVTMIIFTRYCSRFSETNDTFLSRVIVLFCLHVPTGVSPIDDTEYAAIKTIHRQLDDNADGSVDLSESAEVSRGILCGIPLKKVWFPHLI